MDFDTYNELNSGDKRAILESIFADNTDLLFNEDRGEDYDYAQDIIDASYLHFGHLRPDIQNEILSGGYDAEYVNKPIRDVTGNHLDIVNFTNEITILEKQFS